MIERGHSNPTWATVEAIASALDASIIDVPDALLSKVELRMPGAKKGLVVNSRNLCGSVSDMEQNVKGWISAG